MSRPKLLFLAHRVPYPPNRGDRIRSFHLLKFLSARADVHLAFLAESAADEATMQVLRGLCRQVAGVPLGRRTRWLQAVRSFAAGRTATEGLFYSRTLHQIVRRWSRETPFDAVFVFCSSMVQYLRDLSVVSGQWSGARGQCRRTTGIVVDLVDVDSQKWFDYAAHARGPKRHLLRLEGRRLRRLEASLPERVDAVTLVSPQEVELYQSFCPSDRVFAVRNGVDLEYFCPQESGVKGQRAEVRGQRPAYSQSPPITDHPSPITRHRSPVTDHRPPVTDPRSPTPGHRLPITDHRSPITAPCLFVGALDYDANLDGVTWFCREIWPRVRQAHADAVFQLVGSRPGPAAERLGRLPGVNLVGEVPDVRPYLGDAALVVVPLRVARGIQNKVLEALAMGKALVATPPALEGIGLSPGVHACQAATADQWVRSVGELLADTSECRRLGVAGRKFVQQHFHWEARLQDLANIPGLGRCFEPSAIDEAA